MRPFFLFPFFSLYAKILIQDFAVPPDNYDLYITGLDQLTLTSNCPSQTIQIIKKKKKEIRRRRGIFLSIEKKKRNRSSVNFFVINNSVNNKISDGKLNRVIYNRHSFDKFLRSAYSSRDENKEIKDINENINPCDYGLIKSFVFEIVIAKISLASIFETEEKRRMGGRLGRGEKTLIRLRIPRGRRGNTYLFSAHFRISSAERYDARYAFKIFENNRFPIMSVRGRRLLIKRIPACS